MRAHLINSAMMPAAGHYKLVKIDRETFVNYLNMYLEKGTLKSYIGYESTLEHIKRIADVRLSLNRVQLTDLQPGDVLLICKLKYRLADASLKANKEFQNQIDDSDFEYFICFYSK